VATDATARSSLSRASTTRTAQSWRAPSPVRSGLVTQAVRGVRGHREIDPHVREVMLPVGATYLLCSDGLTDMVKPADIRSATEGDVAEGAEKLFNLAMAAGGADNVSVVLVSVG